MWSGRATIGNACKWRLPPEGRHVICLVTQDYWPKTYSVDYAVDAGQELDERNGSRSLAAAAPSPNRSRVAR